MAIARGAASDSLRDADSTITAQLAVGQRRSYGAAARRSALQSSSGNDAAAANGSSRAALTGPERAHLPERAKPLIRWEADCASSTVTTKRRPSRKSRRSPVPARTTTAARFSSFNEPR
jgi:hypothetical protein